MVFVHYIRSMSSLSLNTSCSMSLRTILSGLSRGAALNYLANHCDELIQYPEQAILSPVLTMFYNKSSIILFYEKYGLRESLPKTTPDIICLNGSLMCNGTQISLHQVHCVNYDEFQMLASYPIFPIPNWFCQVATTQSQGTKLER